MTTPTCTTIKPAISRDIADTITLDETARHRRRIKLTSDNGIEFLLDLPQARLLRHGEGLILSDGRVIEICAVPEPLMEVIPINTRHLTRLAWQIGNRHLAAQIEETRILLRPDHVVREMLERLGAKVRDVSEPFNPEGGAYSHHSSDIEHSQTEHSHG